MTIPKIKQIPTVSQHSGRLIDNLLMKQYTRYIVYKDNNESMLSVYKARKALEKYILTLESKG